MKLIFIFIVSVIGLFGCSKSKHQSNDILDSLTNLPTDTIEIIDTTKFEYEDYQKLESYLSRNKIKNDIFETIDFDCAILIYPTDRQIENMKQEYGEDDFYTIADDNEYYQGQAIEYVIDSLGIKKVTASKQFLRLKGITKTWDLDIRKKNLPAWNIIFFKTTKSPEIISAIDLTVEQTKKYFEIEKPPKKGALK